MNFEIIALPNFEKEFKRLYKKYPSLKVDISLLSKSLQAEPQQGTPLGNHCYKIRLAITSKHQGKSGGARIITVVRIITERVYLASIYDKSEQESISVKDLKEIIKKL